MYGLSITMPAPVETYEELHAEMIKRAGTAIDGLLVHIGRAHPDGFEVLEIWESKEQYDRANVDIVFPLMRELLGDAPDPSMAPQTTLLDVRGLVMPRGDILV